MLMYLINPTLIGILIGFGILFILYNIVPKHTPIVAIIIGILLILYILLSTWLGGT